ncbi:MAG TPA: alcohol dehydrogenase catalytic domain-containing protein [Mycobacteriales bacterium]|nr:alcohol dehydrogenase catalytic domain-containing protein [Mycobacteriales bacterium]
MTAALEPTMRAAVIDGPGQLSVRMLDRPEPGPREVVVRIEYCGICGSDLHGVLDGWMAPGTVEGHEWSGKVVAVGADVTQWSVGDAVVGGPPWCGECQWCKAGRPALCVADPLRNSTAGHTGGFAQYHLSSAASLHAIPPGLDLRTAALAEPLAVALHGITAAKLPADPAGLRLLVSGGGPLGLLVAAALRAFGADDVTVSEPSPARRKQAAAVGATAVLAPEELPAVPDLPMEAHQDGFHTVIETSGQGSAVATCIGLLRPTGTLVLLGTGAMTVRMDAIRILLNELVVTGAYCYDDGGIDAALGLLASGRLPIDALLSPTDIGLDDLLDTMNRLRAGEIPTKALVRP